LFTDSESAPDDIIEFDLGYRANQLASTICLIVFYYKNKFSEEEDILCKECFEVSRYSEFELHSSHWCSEFNNLSNYEDLNYKCFKCYAPIGLVQGISSCRECFLKCNSDIDEKCVLREFEIRNPIKSYAKL
jgi:hypothetical protein